MDTTRGGRPDRAIPLSCAVGLLLTLTAVPGFGLDFADDTVGYSLLALGAARAAAGGAAARGWWRLVAGSAVMTALISLVGYGGLLTHLVPYTFRWWSTLSYLQVGADAVTVAALVAALWVAHRGRPGYRYLPFLALGLLVAGVAQAVLLANTGAYVGGLASVRQVVGVVLGLFHLVAVVMAFDASVPAVRRVRR